MNRFTKLMIVIALSMLVCVSGCKRKDTINNDPNNNDINGLYYGVASDSTFKIYNQSQLLYELPYKPYHKNVIVKGNTIYATIVENNSTNKIMSLWKNGHIQYNIITTYDVIPRGLCLGGNNIFTTGRIKVTSSDSYCGKVWKNRELLYTLEIPDGSGFFYTYMAVAVANDVYVSGSYYNNSSLHAIIWKNGNIYFTTEGGDRDCIRGIGYYNGSLYWYGSEGSSEDIDAHGKIWKDGHVICDAKEKNWASYGDINDAIIYNGDVWAAGFIHIEPGSVSDEGNEGMIGVVWKNGDILYEISDKLLTSSYNSNWSEVKLSSINIIDEDVYVSGIVYGIGGEITKIWRNGEEYLEINNGIYGVGNIVYLLKNGMNYNDQF